MIKDQSRSIILITYTLPVNSISLICPALNCFIILTRVACLTLADIAEALGAQWFLGKGADKALVPIIRNAMVSVKPRVPRLREISPLKRWRTDDDALTKDVDLSALTLMEQDRKYICAGLGRAAESPFTDGGRPSPSLDHL